MPFFGAFGAAWDDAMVAHCSVNLLGMLWPEVDVGFGIVSTAGNGGGPAAVRRPGRGPGFRLGPKGTSAVS